jgi:hypothetical protein
MRHPIRTNPQLANSSPSSSIHSFEIWTQVCQETITAEWSLSFADSPSEVDQLVCHQDPLFLRKYSYKILFNLDRIFLVAETQPI